MDDVKLLPCPFCGSPAEIERGSDHHGSWFNLGCSHHWGRVTNPDKACLGGRLFYTEFEKSETEAIAAWNTRTPSSDGQAEALLAEAVEALQAVNVQFNCVISAKGSYEAAKEAVRAILAKIKEAKNG